MSKFTDKLERLHSSRVRALEADEEGTGQARVFIAEQPQAVVVEPPVGQSAQPTQLEPVADTPARSAIRRQLEHAERVGKKARRTKPAVKPTEPIPNAAQVANRRTEQSANAVGERLADLRRRAEALIGVGGLDSALPLLHEMAALSPTHPYALAQLAAYWAEVGNQRLSDLYAQRLAAIAPY